MKSLFALNAFNAIYDNDTVKRIKAATDCLGIYGADVAQVAPDELAQAEIIFSGWGAPKMDKEFLDKAPNLKIVFYGAGSIRGMVSDEFWDRGIRVCSAWAANAVPVSEYCLGQILLSLKSSYYMARKYKESKGKELRPPFAVKGCYKSTVGVVSAGMIGRKVLDLLKPFDINVLVYEYYMSEEEARDKYNAQKVDSLEELFEKSDVVTLHTAAIPENYGMITGKLIDSMKEGSTLLNSSRGIIINEDEMIEVLKRRPDLTAILDVTYPYEPPKEDSELYTLDNVVLTPHIAGSLGQECFRHAEYMCDEMDRFFNGEPLLYEIDRQRAEKMA